jgi:hypothetical protein
VEGTDFAFDKLMIVEMVKKYPCFQAIRMFHYQKHNSLLPDDFLCHRNSPFHVILVGVEVLGFPLSVAYQQCSILFPMARQPLGGLGRLIF